MKYKNIREEELKNKLANDYFWHYDCTKIIGNLDFCVGMFQKERSLFEYESLLWAEAKTASSDIYNSIVQLILTIGKARTFDKHLPPNMLGAFDGEKIAFIPYSEINDVFYLNDFNWNVTPSNHLTKEFQLIHEKVKQSIDAKALLFYYEKDDKELKKFIKNNFVVGKFGLTKNQIDKNNFMIIYNKWLQTVMPTIAVNWDIAKKKGIIDGDFYLADLLSEENVTLKDKLFVLLKTDHYELDRKLDDAGLFHHSSADFRDNQVAHNQFWNKYDRPPKEEYWDYIVERRDLLVPQDVRERKGSFFTPQIWVELSQKYLTDVLGENWQDEYYIWNCAAGTGNLLAGLTNKYNIYASTLDKQDVEVMRDRIKNGANLLESHVFQFDFLNDDFTKLPASLKAIIDNEEKRKKLLIYINPPYKRGLGVAYTNWHKNEMGAAKDELFAQFLYRIYIEINGCIIAQFSTLKLLQAPNFKRLRKSFQPKLEKIFLAPAYTFDNVDGKFPIGFFIWDTKKMYSFDEIIANVYNENSDFIQKKYLCNYDKFKFINNWLKEFTKKSNGKIIGALNAKSNDFQQQKWILIGLENVFCQGHMHRFIYSDTLIKTSIYFSIRHCISATWINDRDQFLYPRDGWQSDTEFQSDCLAYALFHGQNRISSKIGINHWIPFTEQEVAAKDTFESHFMTQFISGKLKKDAIVGNLFECQPQPANSPLEFSAQATAVFEAGKALWKYYHQQHNTNVNASLYDIREHFQGRNKKGRMNPKSNDPTYTKLIATLREKLQILAQKIEPKVYAYEFLKR